eukprot:tig00020693_g13023.t1
MSQVHPGRLEFAQELALFALDCAGEAIPPSKLSVGTAIGILKQMRRILKRYASEPLTAVTSRRAASPEEARRSQIRSAAANCLILVGMLQAKLGRGLRALFGAKVVRALDMLQDLPWEIAAVNLARISATFSTVLLLMGRAGESRRVLERAEALAELVDAPDVRPPPSLPPSLPTRLSAGGGAGAGGPAALLPGSFVEATSLFRRTLELGGYYGPFQTDYAVTYLCSLLLTGELAEMKRVAFELVGHFGRVGINAYAAVCASLATFGLTMKDDDEAAEQLSDLFEIILFTSPLSVSSAGPLPLRPLPAPQEEEQEHGWQWIGVARALAESLLEWRGTGRAGAMASSAAGVLALAITQGSPIWISFPALAVVLEYAAWREAEAHAALSSSGLGGPPRGSSFGLSFCGCGRGSAAVAASEYAAAEAGPPKGAAGPAAAPAASSREAARREAREASALVDRVEGALKAMRKSERVAEPLLELARAGRPGLGPERRRRHLQASRDAFARSGLRPYEASDISICICYGTPRLRLGA